MVRLYFLAIKLKGREKERENNFYFFIWNRLVVNTRIHYFLWCLFFFFYYFIFFTISKKQIIRPTIFNAELYTFFFFQYAVNKTLVTTKILKLIYWYNFVFLKLNDNIVILILQTQNDSWNFGLYVLFENIFSNEWKWQFCLSMKI